MEGVVRSVAGHRGEVRSGYQLAATVGSWTLIPGGRLLRSVVTSQDAAIVSQHWFEQEPLSLILDVGYAQWTWHNAVVKITAAGQLSAEVMGRPLVDRLR